METAIRSFSCMESMKDKTKKEWYSYTLPEGGIRSNPLPVRHNAKLFVYDTKNDVIHHTTFFHLDEYLPEETLLILNESKVLPVRLSGTTKHGGKREVFLLLNEEKKGELYPCLIKGSSKVGDVLMISRDASVQIVEIVGETRYVAFPQKSMQETIDLYGATPLPHYIESTLSEDEAKMRYQTVFARSSGERGSVAAPTASLHFTHEVFAKLHAKGIVKKTVALHVGRGTFSPLEDEMIEARKLHKEYYSIPSDTRDALASAKAEGKHVCAVGTTSMRTLESYAASGNLSGETDIFIVPPHTFSYADMMMTNFHLPQTSLMMLVEAFLEYKGSRKTILDLYAIAIEKEYQFYSFGDSMLII